MALILNDSELAEAGMSAKALRLEIALWLYVQGRLSAGQASRMAQCSRVAFQKALGSRKIPSNYDLEEWNRDLDTLGL
jgi:predicted HTH domain antitoxin